MAAKQASDLPFNIEAEKAVIGSALISKDAAIVVTSSLVADDFFLAKHQIIFKAMVYLAYTEHKDIDSVTLIDELLNMKELDNIGGVEYLKECSDSMVSMGALEFYIHSVKDNSILRNMLTTIRGIDTKYRTQEITNITSFLNESENSFRDSIKERRISDFVKTESLIEPTKQKLESLQNSDRNITGLTSGYARLDKYTLGFQPGNMYVLAARTSVGKTAFAVNVAFRAATQANCAVGIFSLEMSKEQLFNRFIGMNSTVNIRNIELGRLNNDERLKVNAAINQVGAANIYIDETQGISMNELTAKARKLLKLEPNLKLLVIDHLSLIGNSEAKSNRDSRQDEVRKYSGALKGLAKELKIPVLVVAQLNRDIEKRDSKTPMLSDLRESGAIEQDADVVMLLNRSDYYPDEQKKKTTATQPVAQWEQERAMAPTLPGNASYVELIVRKNRNGQCGQCGLFFYKDFCLFDEPSEDWSKALEKVTNPDL